MDTNKLKFYRNISGYTQTSLAAKIGMTQATYARKESGESYFTRDEIVKIIDTIYPNLLAVNPSYNKKDLMLEIFFHEYYTKTYNISSISFNS